MEKLDEAMSASVQYQDALQVGLGLHWVGMVPPCSLGNPAACFCAAPQGMFDYLDNAVIKLCDMPAVGTDLGTVKQQIEELKVSVASRSLFFLLDLLHFPVFAPFLCLLILAVRGAHFCTLLFIFALLVFKLSSRTSGLKAVAAQLCSVITVLLAQCERTVVVN